MGSILASESFTDHDEPCLIAGQNAALQNECRVLAVCGNLLQWSLKENGAFFLIVSFHCGTGLIDKGKKWKIYSSVLKNRKVVYCCFIYFHLSSCVWCRSLVKIIW